MLLAQSAYEGKITSTAYNFGPKPESSAVTTNALLAHFLRQIDVKVFQANFPDEPDFRNLIVDSTKAKQDLGWEPLIASPIDLAKWTTDWYTNAKQEPWKITENLIAQYEKNING